MDETQQATFILSVVDQPIKRHSSNGSHRHRILPVKSEDTMLPSDFGTSIALK